MLSERDRRTLAEIEHQLAADARFAAALGRAGRPGSRRAERWARRGYDAMIVLSGLTAVLCFALLLVCAGTVAVLLAGVACYLRQTRFPLRPARYPRRSVR